MKRPIIFSMMFLTFALFACNNGRDEIDTLTQERDALQTQVTELNEQIAAATDASGALQAERDTFQTQAGELTTNIDALTGNVNSLTDQLSTVEAERDALSARLTDLERSSATLNRQVIVLTGELERSQGRLIEESATRDASLGNIQSELQTEISDMRAQLEDLSNLLAQVESERGTLRLSTGVGEGLIPPDAGATGGAGATRVTGVAAPAAATATVNTVPKVRALEEQAEALELRLRDATLGETGGQ